MSKDIIQTILLESLKISSQSDAPREGSRPCKRLVFLATKLTSVRSLHLLLNSGGRENKFWYVEKIGSSLDVSQGFLKWNLLNETIFEYYLSSYISTFKVFLTQEYIYCKIILLAKCYFLYIILENSNQLNESYKIVDRTLKK